jgi:ubiquinol-cytochrome c reductase subunit 6
VFTECKESKACAPVKHHFDECVERVTGADEGKPVDKKHPNEDCVEECESHCRPLQTTLAPIDVLIHIEVFHLAHCASHCAAPKLWAALK